MGFTTALYRGITKRTSTYAFAIVGSIFIFERGLDSFTDYIWETNNRGKLWKHIEPKYIKE